MKANELRIGNLVWGSLKQHYKVSAELIQMVVLNPDWVDPIPLTPEILEKAGFVKVEKEEKRLANPNVYYQFSGVEVFTGHNGGEVYFGTAKLFTVIKYVHQLQNLIFALTDEELEINLLS